MSWGPVDTPKPTLRGSKNTNFLKIVPKILENHQNDMEMCYKHISRYICPLESGLEPFLYDLKKIDFDHPTPSPLRDTGLSQDSVKTGFAELKMALTFRFLDRF